MRYLLSIGLGVLLLGPTLPAEGAPSIVLVMADDQGWGDMAYNGHPHLKTPNFDAMAREGVRFDRFHAAAPVCSPTRGSVLTGRHPNRFGCFSWGYPLRPQETTLAEALKDAGYRTGHFGKWHLGSVQKASPVCPGASGFGRWVSSPNFFDLDPILSVEGKAVPFPGDSSDVTVEAALKFIRDCASKDERFLAVVWFGSPHVPHQALPRDRAPYADLSPELQNFYGEITAMDRAFGRLRQALRDLDLRENTLLWYCSDNGALPDVGSTGGSRGRKDSIYEGGLLVPALLEWPGTIDAPRVIDVPCVTSDLFPTVLELTGVAVESPAPIDGVSLVPLLRGESSRRPKPIGFWRYPAPGIRTPSKQWMAELYADQQRGHEPDDPSRIFPDAAALGPPVPLDRFPGHSAWLDGPWKLHRIEDPGTHAVRLELYDLAADPGESQDLLDQQPERAATLQSGLEGWLQSVARSHNGEDGQGRESRRPTPERTR